MTLYSDWDECVFGKIYLLWKCDHQLGYNFVKDSYILSIRKIRKAHYRFQQLHLSNIENHMWGWLDGRNVYAPFQYSNFLLTQFLFTIFLLFVCVFCIMKQNIELSLFSGLIVMRLATMVRKYVQLHPSYLIQSYPQQPVNNSHLSTFTPRQDLPPLYKPHQDLPPLYRYSTLESDIVSILQNQRPRLIHLRLYPQRLNVCLCPQNWLQSKEELWYQQVKRLVKTCRHLPQRQLLHNVMNQVWVQVRFCIRGIFDCLEITMICLKSSWCIAGFNLKKLVYLEYWCDIWLLLCVFLQL